MSTAPAEQQEEEQRPIRYRPVIIKLRPGGGGVRLVGCPAWPITGTYAGASMEWCQRNQGKITACGKCKWKTA